MKYRNWIIGFIIMWIGAQAAAQEKLWRVKTKSKSMPTRTNMSPDFSALAKQILPTVVAIQAEQHVKQDAQAGPLRDPLDYLYRQFGSNLPREYINRGLGSGFIIRKDGLILTNYHVVENADKLEVTFSLNERDEQQVNAKVLGVAPEYDIALIQAQAQSPIRLPVAFLGDSEAINIGDWVLAIGNPFGLSHSVSVGIISAKRRRNIKPSGRQGLYDFLQTDASINPGNSGGPLVNLSGEVIGMNSAINAAGTGIGFAIPINMIKEMLPELKSKGQFEKSWIGIKIQPLTPELATSFGLNYTRGALVSQVIPESPAHKAGVQSGDVILEFDHKALQNANDLSLYASMAGVGRQVLLKIWRAQKTITTHVTLTVFPRQKLIKPKPVPQDRSAELGFTVADIQSELKHQYRLEVDHGIVIIEVLPASRAARAGLLEGDVILRLNGKSLNDAKRFIKSVKGQKTRSIVRLKILRQAMPLFIALQKP